MRKMEKTNEGNTEQIRRRGKKITRKEITLYKEKRKREEKTPKKQERSRKEEYRLVRKREKIRTEEE